MKVASPFRLLVAAALAASLVHSALAAPKQKQKTFIRRALSQPTAPVQSAHRKSPYVGAASADASNGRILFSENAAAEAYPASVTKLMTLFLVLEDVRAGRYSFATRATATPAVNYSEASWIGIKVGESMTVHDLCLALMVESANDAAIVLAVNSAGSLDAFVARMNARARELGMANTRYYNPSGLPPNAKRRYPWKSYNVTTAADQLKLACALLKLPGALSFTSVKTCDLVKTEGGYRVFATRRVGEPNRTTELAPGEKLIMQYRNHNNIMVKDKQKILNPDGREAVDGLKTGFINAGGSSVVLTGSRGGKRAVVVVLGSASASERDENASRLLADALGAMVW